MDFTPLLRIAWQTAWRHRGWWLLGLIGGGVVGPVSLPSFSLPSSRQQQALQAQWQRAMDLGQAAALAWAREHLALLAIWAGVSLALLILVWYWSISVQGALSWTTIRLAAGQEVSRRQARRVGRRLFWRYFRLWLIPFALGVAVLAIEGGYVWRSMSTHSLASAFQSLTSLAGTPILFLVGLISVPLGIWVALAKRVIVVEDVAAGAALGISAGLIRADLGQALLAWLIGFAVWWAGLLAAIIGLAIVGIIIAVAVGVFLAFLATRVALSAGVAPYAVGASLLFTLAILIAIGIVNLFMWSFWSQVYLRLRARRSTFASIALG